MNNDKPEEAGKEFITVKPADIELTQTSPSEKKPQPKSPAGKPNHFIWTGLVILVCIALGVIFILPQWIKPVEKITVNNESPSQENSGVNGVKTTVAKPSHAEVSPWDEAQQARLRKTSQELLAKMLEAQALLEQKGVRTWATDDYDHAINFAKEGDAAYREQQFQQANELYGKALDEFTGLVEEMETVFSEAIKTGELALTNGNSSRAKEAFDLAIMIKPDDAAALRGQQRARTLDEVLGLIAKGNDLQQNEQLGEARESYQAALDLDQYAEQAIHQLEHVNQKIRDRDFNKYMSTGYASLDGNQLADARRAFGQALKLKPGTSEAVSALEQTVQRITNNQINTWLNSAREFEKNENWTEAVSAYDKALTLDNSLVPAHEGKQYATMRAGLDQKLQKTLAQPERLFYKAVYNEAAALAQQARSIDNKGPRLSQQINNLAKMLQLASTPVTVTFQSDNQTNVTLYKVGTLGNFQNKQLSLLPGHYVAVGNRQGYRDVRVEFTVHAEKPIAPVIVLCQEKIALGK